MPDLIPLPESFPEPLPEFLHRRHVLLLFEHWNIGSAWYLNQLVQAKKLHRIQRPPLKNNRIYRTTEVLKIYKETKGNYTRALLEDFNPV